MFVGGSGIAFLIAALLIVAGLRLSLRVGPYNAHDPDEPNAKF